jgi:hypothetical protein
MLGMRTAGGRAKLACAIIRNLGAEVTTTSQEVSLAARLTNAVTSRAWLTCLRRTKFA